MKRIPDLKHDPLGKLFGHYLIASVVSMLIAAFHRVIDSVFIGNGIGKFGIAAFNITLPLLAWVWSVVILFTIGGSTVFALRRGQGDAVGAKNVFYLSNLFLAVFVAIVMIFGLSLMEPVCMFLGCDTGTLPYAVSYLKIQLFFLPVLALNGILSAFVKNDSNPRLVMYSIALSSLSNIALNYIAIFVLNWGMRGISFATGIAQLLGVVLLLSHFRSEQAGFDYKVWRMRWNHAVAAFIVKTGIPSFLTEASFAIALLFMNRVVGGLAGKTGIAAVGIMFAVIDFIYIMMYGVAVTMQPIVSFNHGANDHARVWNTLRLAIKISFFIGLGLTVTGLFGAEFLVRLINRDDPRLVQMATKLVRYNFLTMPITAISTNIQIFYQSISRANIATALTVMRNALFVIGVLYLMRALFGIEGVWLTYPIADILSASVYAICYRKLKRKYIGLQAI